MQNKYPKGIIKVKKTTVEALRNFFGKGVELKVTSKISDEISAMFSEQQAVSIKEHSELLAIKDKLERLIMYAANDYKKAKKLFKRGEVSKDELFECENRLIKLKNELDEINFKLK